MSRKNNEIRLQTRRQFLKTAGVAPLLLHPSPFHGTSLLFDTAEVSATQSAPFHFSDTRLIPRYPAKSPLEAVLRLVPPGFDEYQTEKYAFEIEAALNVWGNSLRNSVHDHATLARFLGASFKGTPLRTIREMKVRESCVPCVKRYFSQDLVAGTATFTESLSAWLENVSQVHTAEFQITGIEEVSAGPLVVRAQIRYNMFATRTDSVREERVGTWQTEWLHEDAAGWKAGRWEAGEEVVSSVKGAAFVDVTSQALGSTGSYRSQLLRGSDHWRTVLDGACGIDVYGNNGLAAGDFDNDGLDDLYVCQPAGLPNRLYHNRGDGSFEDVTEKAGVGVLDNTACALFADFRNVGLQDLLVVCGAGPLLFLNRGDGTFVIKRDAFKFAQPPKGTFTHAALADYDRDGRLDIYFCLYSYYLGLDQYHYPIPYFDARNGPPNYLLHNEGNGSFIDRTEASGLNAENDRYSFASAWGAIGSSGFPDLYVANDFGRNNLYRNNGDGSFTAVSVASHVQDAGAGMSACWGDFSNNGKQDVYVANMWSAAGQRVSMQKHFHEEAAQSIRELYQRHARGNALYKNKGEGDFENASRQAGVEMGRWAWCSDFFDFDHDGYADLYVTNGYISAFEQNDLGSFFWRQVVAKSPDDATPSMAYEHGWNALNELIRSDRSWNGHERNVVFANNGDGTFSEASGPLGLDFNEDSRAFVLADINHDGRLEVILKNRNAPQIRILQNEMPVLGDSVIFRLRGHISNRDAIGSCITLECGKLRQTKFLQAGSGFLAQHSKEVFFGLGKVAGPLQATVRWPTGVQQQFHALPANHRIEIEEGSAEFVAKSFAARPRYADQAPPSGLEALPAQVETWLLEPLIAPAFALPDRDGRVHELASLRGSFVVVSFWDTVSLVCSDFLAVFEQHWSVMAAARVKVLAVNVDDASSQQKAGSFAEKQRLSFPVLFGTEEIAGVYNIVYRYLYDRRRDLALPTSFLVDTEGMIVKIYQGMVDPGRVLEDVRSAPKTLEDRMKKGLPFRGQLYHNAFFRNEFTYGVAMFQHGYLEQAEASFKQVIAANPEDAEGFYNLGTLSLRRNNFEQARQYLRQTLKLRPNYPEAWNNLGMMAAQEGQADEAINDFQESLKLRPNYATALLNLGNVYRRQHLFSKAEDCLTRALAMQPDDPEVNYSLGMFYAQQGQLQAASDYLNKALQFRPDYPEALNNLGVLFVREQQNAKAEDQFKSCIRVAPEFDQSYINLARLYAMQNDKLKAEAILRELLALQPQNANASKALGSLQTLP